MVVFINKKYIFFLILFLKFLLKELGFNVKIFILVLYDFRN